MWNTKIEHKENQVCKTIHDFGQGVTIVADLVEPSLKRYHGKIIVAEYDFSFYSALIKYEHLLMNIDMEVNPDKYANQ